MRSVEGFYALSDMDRMGMMPAVVEPEEPRIYESIPGTRPEDRVVPPGYVSLDAILDEARAMEMAEGVDITPAYQQPLGGEPQQPYYKEFGSENY